jgi:DNA polymerase III subunit gamma/tau
MVYYRKYRPQKIDDLDSAAVRETLTSVLKKNVPHAFLFTGPKGLGKTSTARILAKAVNCTDKKAGSVEPCNACDQCLAITNGTSIDILEIDAASNRGIDEIRDLKEKIRLSPVSSLKKVYIIDEVHMLTTEAFNALLKTLEEPPEHAMFILCTTEPQKVPSTILSRCFHVSFKPATEVELLRAFKRIKTAEKIDIDDEALQYIAQLSGRGFRDGVKILEEMVLVSDGKKIDRKLVETTYKTLNLVTHTQLFLRALNKKDPKKALEIIAAMVEMGIDLKYFLNDVMEKLHQLLLIHVGVLEKDDFLAEFTFSLEDIKQITGLLSRANGEMKYAVLPQLPLELVVLEWANPTAVNPSTPLREEKSKDGDSSTSPRMADDLTVNTMRKQVGDMKRKEALYGVPKKDPKADEDVVKIETTTVELMHTPGDGEVTREWLDLFWKNLINETKKHNHTVAGVLRSCAIKSFSKQGLVIETAYKFHKERLDDVKNMDQLLRICKALTGNEMDIVVELRK